MYGEEFIIYLKFVIYMYAFFGTSRAFSDLFGKFLVLMKLGKSCVLLGKKIHNFGKK